jgi:GH25 family lysozyme M1 (1,4-beta-N-acetylmuramidase)
MSDIVYGCDISAWQGHAGPDFNTEKMWESGLRYVILKIGQDDWIDRCFLFNYAAFRASPHPWMIGGYWFTTTFNALVQAQTILNATQSVRFDFPIYQDVEFYTRAPSTPKANLGYLDGREAWPVLEYRYKNPPLSMRIAPGIYGMEITTQAIVDVIARKLAGQQGWAESGVYTNIGSGNVVFTKPVMARLHLWVAHWPLKGQTLIRPSLPTIWKPADKWMIWQYCVDSGVPHGFPGGLDHDQSGNTFPDEAPPVAEEYQYCGYRADGKVMCGVVKERC